MVTDITRTLQEIISNGFAVEDNYVHLRVPNARNVLFEGLKSVTENPKWIKPYDKIVDWMEDNKGKGLLAMGQCGLGKTLICYKILPAVFLKYAGKVLTLFDATELNKHLDDVLSCKLVCIDDLGIEDTVIITYGNKRIPFAELVDAAEKKDKLLVITTNLNVEEIRDRYGERVMDRLRAVTTPVLFTGKSMRQ